MRIDPADAMTPSTGPDPARRKAEPQAQKSAEASQADGVAAPEAETRRYVEKARAAGEVNAAAVAEARRLLEASELDTPDAARRAAAAMLDRGP